MVALSERSARRGGSFHGPAIFNALPPSHTKGWQAYDRPMRLLFGARRLVCRQPKGGASSKRINLAPRLGFEPMRSWLIPPFRSGMMLRRLSPGNRNYVRDMQDRPVTKREAPPICPNSALIEVAFQSRKSESWAHADGNEVS